MACALLRDQELDQYVDLGAGHVPLVAEFMDSQRFEGQRRLHCAHLRRPGQHDGPREFVAQQVSPTVDHAARAFRVVADGVRIVPGGEHRYPARRPGRPVALGVEPQVAERGVALACLRVGREAAGLAQVGHLVPVRYPRGIDGLKHPRRDESVHVVEMALRHVIFAVGIRHRGQQRAVSERLPLYFESEIARGAGLEFVDDASRQAHHPQRRVRGPEDTGQARRQGGAGARRGEPSPRQSAPVVFLLPGHTRVPPSGS